MVDSYPIEIQGREIADHVLSLAFFIIGLPSPSISRFKGFPKPNDFNLSIKA